MRSIEHRNAAASEVERRLATGRVEVRAASAADGGKSRIGGYGALFNSETVIGSWFREKIMPGAFAGVIGKDCDVRALFNHDANFILGRSTVGTLRLSEDDTGLQYEADVNAADPMAVGVAARIARGDVSGSSFSFRVKTEEWIYPDEGSADLPLRIIHEYAELYDVGPVTFPAYEDTTSEARVRQVLENRSVPKNISTKKAPTDTPWSAPALGDFTSKTWNELSGKERTGIAGHFAWKAGDAYSDLHLPHHRASDGAIVLRGVVAAAGRIDQTAGVSKSAVRAHLEAHYHAFGLKAPWEANASSQADVDAAIARQDAELGEEAAELVQYQTIATMLEQATATVGSAIGLARELIADETETPTETDAGEAAEEEVESARLVSLVAFCRQSCATLEGVSALATSLLEDEDDDAAAAGASATLDGSNAIADADRGRRLQLVHAQSHLQGA